MSKLVEQLADGDLNYRERINFHFRSGGKTILSERDQEILARCEVVQELLMLNRGDRKIAKLKIKERFKLTHREEVDRYIEDACYLMGAMFTQDKNYQRLIQHDDIEKGLELAIKWEDGKMYAALLAERRKLYRLDEADEINDASNFMKLVIVMEFRPQDFADRLPTDYMERAYKMKNDAMIKVGLKQDEITDVTEVEYTTR